MRERLGGAASPATSAVRAVRQVRSSCPAGSIPRSGVLGDEAAEHLTT